MKKPKKPLLDSFTPSRDLQRQAERLLEEYPLADLTERLRTLSRNMNREGECFADHAQNVLSETTAGTTQAMTAAGDLIDIRDMICDIAAGKPLERDFTGEEGNSHLRLFDSHHPKLPPRIRKCLEATLGWCEEQLDELDNRATALATAAAHESDEEKRRVAKTVHYLDETGGMIFRINQLAEAAIDEVKAARRAAKSSGRAA